MVAAVATTYHSSVTAAAAATWILVMRALVIQPLVVTSFQDVGISWKVDVNCSSDVSAAFLPAANCRARKLTVPLPEVQQLGRN